MLIAGNLTKDYYMEVTPQQSLLNELDCINKAKQDSKHFKPLYEKYYQQIFLFIYRRVGDKELAYDITADVFLKSLLKLSSYKFQQLPFSSWLYRIARNKLVDIFRKNKNIRVVNVESQKLNSIIDEIAIDPHEKHHATLLKLISTLDEDNTQLIEMRFFEDKSFKEIAEILDSTEAAVKMKLYRLLEKLKYQIENAD